MEFFIFLILLINLLAFGNSQCPESTNSKFPHFVKDMKKSIIGILNKPKTIYCCVDGFDNLLWTFKSLSLDYSSKDIILSDRNRTLFIEKIRIDHGGYYSCNASNLFGNSVSEGTKMIIGCTPDNIEMTIEVNMAQKLNYYNHKKGNICCKISASKFNQFLRMKWSLFSINYNFSTVILSYEAHKQYLLPYDKLVIWSNTSLSNKNVCSNDLVTVTCLEFNDLNFNDSGNYTCTIESLGKFTEHNFELLILEYIDNIPIYLLYITICFLITTLIMIIIWILYYDILLKVKQKFSFKNNVKNFKLLIVYDDTENVSLSIAITISDYLSKFGITSFIFDRDKKYGSNIYEDYITAIYNSTKVLFLLTPSCTINEKVLFCFKNTYQQKFYVFYSSRSKVLNYFNKNEMESTMFENIKSSRDYAVWKNKYINESFFQKRFIKWILIHLA